MPKHHIIIIMLLLTLTVACASIGSLVATDTPVPPTNTPVPSTDTPVSPTDTPVPPMDETVFPTKGDPSASVTIIDFSDYG
ncbi:hypothetical protein QUF64_00385 [Anaerolineales bacterium HSG6]|nr:hypothetical protein [Anaerolineales bacterium HSG6]MDM8529926.1 hypothetical protein [Anaerolineales bacterium HSG25]